MYINEYNWQQLLLPVFFSFSLYAKAALKKIWIWTKRLKVEISFQSMGVITIWC